MPTSSRRKRRYRRQHFMPQPKTVSQPALAVAGAPVINQAVSNSVMLEAVLVSRDNSFRDSFVSMTDRNLQECFISEPDSVGQFLVSERFQ